MNILTRVRDVLAASDNADMLTLLPELDALINNITFGALFPGGAYADPLFEILLLYASPQSREVSINKILKGEPGTEETYKAALKHMEALGLDDLRYKK